jgi:hypothetical protein
VSVAEKNQEIDRLALALHAACSTIQGLADDLSEACVHPAAGDQMLADILSEYNLLGMPGAKNRDAE